MKKHVKYLGTGALAAVAVAAQAQPIPLERLTNNVTIYGIADSGVERLTSVGANRASLTRVPNLTGTFPSRLGYRGAESLGGGLWAQFVLEQGISIDSGVSNQGGRPFGRQSFVGITGGFGTVSLGRQYDLFGIAMNDAAILGPNVYGLGSLDPYIPAARFDNSIQYLGQFGPIGVGANYSFGRDTTSCAGESTTDSDACHAWSAMLKYTTQAWGVSAGFGRQRGAVGAGAGLTSSDRTDDRLSLTAYWRAAAFKIGGGLIRRDNDGTPTQPRSDAYFVEGSYALTPAIALEGMVGQLKYKNSRTGDRSTLYAFRTVYSFSKRSAVYANFGRMNNHGAQALSVSGAQAGGLPVAGQGQSGVMLGIRHTF